MLIGSMPCVTTSLSGRRVNPLGFTGLTGKNGVCYVVEPSSIRAVSRRGRAQAQITFLRESPRRGRTAARAKARARSGGGKPSLAPRSMRGRGEGPGKILRGQPRHAAWLRNRALRVGVRSPACKVTHSTVRSRKTPPPPDCRNRLSGHVTNVQQHHRRYPGPWPWRAPNSVRSVWSVDNNPYPPHLAGSGLTPGVRARKATNVLQPRGSRAGLRSLQAQGDRNAIAQRQHRRQEPGFLHGQLRVLPHASRRFVANLAVHDFAFP